MKLTQIEKLAYEWQNGLCGDGDRTLMDAIAHQDEERKWKLAKEFPNHVEAYRRFHDEPGWWTRVESKMRAHRLGLQIKT